MSTAGVEVARYIRDLAPAYGFGQVSPELVTAQSRLETGNWTSDVFRENLNPFGMKMPTVRPTTAIGTNRGHAVYPSLAAGVRDYFLRQRAFGIPDTPDASRYVAKTVQSGYATDPQYAQKWLGLYAGGPRRLVVLPMLLLLTMAYLASR